MDRTEFFALVSDRPAEELEVLQDAYWLYKRAHAKQAPRKTGEPYVVHPKAVAVILFRFGYKDTHTLAIALLHDVPEDTDTPPRIIVKVVGPLIWQSVEILSKSIAVKDPVTGHTIGRVEKNLVVYYKAIFDAPIEVRRVKCADALQNLGDIDGFDAEHGLRFIEKTEKYVLPIADITCPRMAAEIRTLCTEHKARLKGLIERAHTP